MSQLSFRQQLEQHNKPEEVRQRLAAGQYSQPHADIAQEYLDSLTRDEEAKSSARAEAREEESLSISRKALSISAEANDISRSAKKWAVIAMVVSTISAAAIAIIQIVFGPTQ